MNKLLGLKELMSQIFDFIQQNSEYFAWAFGLVNILLGLLMYVNKQRHERDLKKLEQDLRFSADRRLKIFDLKAKQYGEYVTNLDEFGKKNQVDMPKRMQPIFEQYLKDFLAASELNDTEEKRKVLAWFSTKITELVQEGAKDFLRLKSESNKLKLIATDEMLITFNDLENLTQESMDTTNEFLKNFAEIFSNSEDQRGNNFQIKSAQLGEKMNQVSEKLLQQMRSELSDI